MPIQEICVAPETFEPCLLVIGSHGWRALKRAVFGSVSTGVLHHATCPLVVRGEGYAGEQRRNGAREQVHA
jgi:nucleotide-binding universal stress UspA family protein